MNPLEFDFDIIPRATFNHITIALCVTCITYITCATATYVAYRRSHTPLAAPLTVPNVTEPTPDAVKTFETVIKEPSPAVSTPLPPLVRVNTKADMKAAFLNMTGAAETNTPRQHSQKQKAVETPSDLNINTISRVVSQPPSDNLRTHPMVTRSIAATAAAEAAANDVLKIPLKYKTLTILINEATLNTCDPSKTYGTNIEVDKLTIKCHFIKAGLIPANKYVEIFNRIRLWLNLIKYVGGGPISLVIQQDTNIEFDQKAVNALKFVFDHYINEIILNYKVTQTFGIVTPKIPL